MGRMPPTSPLSLLKRDSLRVCETPTKNEMNLAPFNAPVFSFFPFDFFSSSLSVFAVCLFQME